MKRCAAAAWLLSIALILSGCGGGVMSELPPVGQTQTPQVSGSSAPVIPDDMSDMFSDRDSGAEYEEADAAHIRLTGSSAECDSDAVRISGGTVTILDEGTYIISGTLDDGMIVVASDDTDKTQLVLNGVTVHSKTSAAIYISGSDKVFVTLAPGTENTLSNGGAFIAIDDSNIDAAIYSRSDLTLNGTGSLTVESPAGHGIVCKDDLVFAGGSYTVNCAFHGVDANDSIRVAAGSFVIASGKDGFHAENNDDASLGYVYIAGGSMDIICEGDGVSAGAWMRIDDGAFGILSGGGSVNAEDKISDNWGGFMGGMGGGPGGRPGGNGGGPGGPGGNGGAGSGNGPAENAEDSTSIKGFKAAGDLTVNGGSFTVDSADDAFHSNGTLTVNGGIFDVKSGDDGFHADETMTVNGGTLLISECYEGIEGLSVTVAGGEISIHANDDGLNAAGGTDASGMGGFRGGDMFGASSDSFITVSGGCLYINAGGDGIDSNGALLISGGHVIISGPVTGDTAVLDYGSTGTITGGTFIGTGAIQMAVTFTDSEQGVISVSVGSQKAGTRITLTDSGGAVVMEYTADQDFALVILSSPDLVTGEGYTITVGDASGTFAAS